MSILIKDMKMPTDHPLWIVVHADGTVEANEVSPSRPVGWQTLLNAAVPVPDHGDLVDLNEAADAVCCYDGDAWLDTKQIHIVIPADKEGKG